MRSLDLNLLVVFDAVYRERHVTRAANKLGMSQPAVSNALQRLRNALDDDLLVKTQSGMVATERADFLAGPVHDIVKDLEDLLANKPFEPATATGRITIAAVDYFSTVLMPALMRYITVKAPNVSLHIIPTNGRSMILLDRCEVDLAFASFGTVPPRFHKQVLLRQGYTCVLRRGHPVLAEGLCAQQYASLHHILHNPRGDSLGSTDKALAVLGLERHIALTVGSFLHAEDVLRTSNFILTAPIAVAKRLTRSGELVIAPCPVEIDDSAQKLDMLWHGRFGKRPLTRWIQEIMIEICQDTAF